MSSESTTASVTPSEVDSVTIKLEKPAGVALVETLIKTVYRLLRKEQPKHHKFGPSSLKNREICPGWKNRQHQETGAADEGTLLHLATETRDLSILPESEQRETAQKCIDYVVPLERVALEIHREVRLVVLGGMTFGTADEVILRMLASGKKHADLIDYKFGRWEVDDAKNNRQGFSYVLGVFDRWLDVESVTVHFLMPRLDVVTKHTFFRSDYARLAVVVSTIINRAELWDKTRDPSMLRMEELNCTYCARGGTKDCPLSCAYLVAHAKKYKPLEVADETHSSQISDPEQMKKFYVALKVIEKMVDSGKQHVHAFAQTQDIPGFVRRERKGKVTITDSVLAWPVLKEVFSLSLPDDPKLTAIISSATFSYSDLVKLATEGLKGKDKTAAVANLWNKLQGADCVRESEPTVYLQRDKEDAQATLDALIDVVTTPVAAPALPEPAPVETTTAGPKSCVSGAAVD